MFKRADREIAALNFLLNIPMQNEQTILRQAMQAVSQKNSKSFADEAGDADAEEMMDLLDSPAAAAMADSNHRGAAAAGGGLYEDE